MPLPTGVPLSPSETNRPRGQRGSGCRLTPRAAEGEPECPMSPRSLHVSHFRGRRAGMAEPPERDLASRTPEAGLSSLLSPRALRANVQASWAPGEGAGGRGGSQLGGGRGSPPEEGLTSATPRATGGRGGSRPGPPGCAWPPPPPRPPASSPRPVLAATAAT